MALDDKTGLKKLAAGPPCSQSPSITPFYGPESIILGISLSPSLHSTSVYCYY